MKSNNMKHVYLNKEELLINKLPQNSIYEEKKELKIFVPSKKFNDSICYNDDNFSIINNMP